MPRLSPDDANLWHRAMAGVAPLRRADQRRRPHPDPPPPAAMAALVAAAVTVPPLAEEGSARNPRVGVSGDTTAAAQGAAQPFAGVDRRTAERVRRGRYPVEARLDLHGMTQDEAHRALLGFIAAARAGGRRCVLVITGHGRLSGGVLKVAAPRWLAEPSLRDHVLALAAARPQHGGAGALYVLLRRARRV
jgi:DNA-nicking Smr family endonuclease